MEEKSIPEVRHRRKQLRAQRKGFADKMKELFVVQDYFVYSEVLILILTMFFLIHQYFSMEQYIFLYFKNITFHIYCFVQK